MDSRARLVRFFDHYHPEQLHKVDVILDTYAGQEEALFAALVRKYGPEPGCDNGTPMGLPPPEPYTTAAASAGVGAAACELDDFGGPSDGLTTSMTPVSWTKHTGGTGPVRNYDDATRARLRTRLMAFFNTYNPAQAEAKTQAALTMKATEVFAKLVCLYPKAAEVAASVDGSAPRPAPQRAQLYSSPDPVTRGPQGGCVVA